MEKDLSNNGFPFLTFYTPSPPPPGMNKMVINHLEKLFVTNDAATILRELEVSYFFEAKKCFGDVKN